MLGLGRAAVPRRATLQTSDQIVVQIPHMQVSGHPTPYEIIRQTRALNVASSVAGSFCCTISHIFPHRSRTSRRGSVPSG